jgi:hypothetical protein
VTNSVHCTIYCVLLHQFTEITSKYVTSWVPITQNSHQTLYTSTTCRSEISGVPYVTTCATTTQTIVMWQRMPQRHKPLSRVQITFDVHLCHSTDCACIVYAFALHFLHIHFILCWKLAISNVDGRRNKLYGL